MAKNIDVLVAFINGDDNIKTKNLYIKDDKLFNYNTIIAQRDIEDNDYKMFFVNATKYSSSTSTIQNKLLSLLDEDRNVGAYKTFTNVPINSSKFNLN